MLIIWEAIPHLPVVNSVHRVAFADNVRCHHNNVHRSRSKCGFQTLVQTYIPRTFHQQICVAVVLNDSICILQMHAVNFEILSVWVHFAAVRGEFSNNYRVISWFSINVAVKPRLFIDVLFTLLASNFRNNPVVVRYVNKLFSIFDIIFTILYGLIIAHTKQNVKHFFKWLIY